MLNPPLQSRLGKDYVAAAESQDDGMQAELRCATCDCQPFWGAL